MAELSTSIVYGDLTVTNNEYVKGDMTIDGGLTVNGSITASNINDSNWDTAYDRSVTGVSGSGDGTLTINRQGVADVTTDLSHSHSEYWSTNNTTGSTDFNSITTEGYYYNDSNSNSNRPPGAGRFGHLWVYGWDGSNVIQIWKQRDGDEHWIRYSDSGTWGNWQKIQEVGSETISTSDPSGGSDGDKWFKV